jgi:hypothetical protein
VFHFNKHHLVDNTVPMWVLKAKGNTYYVKHVTSTVGWSTKETPNNPHTKGSLKFKNVNVDIVDDEAFITSSKQ